MGRKAVRVRVPPKAQQAGTVYGLQARRGGGFESRRRHQKYARGSLAQWLEHLVYTEGVIGSSPIGSTKLCSMQHEVCCAYRQAGNNNFFLRTVT